MKKIEEKAQDLLNLKSYDYDSFFLLVTLKNISFMHRQAMNILTIFYNHCIHTGDCSRRKYRKLKTAIYNIEDYLNSCDEYIISDSIFDIIRAMENYNSYLVLRNVYINKIEKSVKELIEEAILTLHEQSLENII